MSVYFENFPRVTHTGELGIDITRRVALADTVLNNPYVFLPYTIKGNDRPEDIAFYYYDSVRFTWLVYFSVGIIDPYYQWPLNDRQFDRYIIDKYKAQANTIGYDVITWTQNTQITDNILHYKNDTGDIISKDTYTLDTNLVQGDWSAVRYYDYETDLNNDKRAIQLVDKKYAKRAEDQLKELLNDGIV
jgi:hypothetical protein